MTTGPRLSDFAHVDGNPQPDGIKAVAVTTRDGVRLRCAVSPSMKTSTRGTILILQGRNEAIEKYFETIADLNARGFMVAIFDWRGQGGSDAGPAGRKGSTPPAERRRRPGHVRRMGDFHADLEAVIHDLLLPDCRAPFALLAHSMGGLVALSAADHLTNRIERMVLSAPLVGLPQRFVGTGLLRLIANGMKFSGFGRVPVRGRVLKPEVATVSTNMLTSDPRRFQRNRRLSEENPQLFLNAPSFSWVAAITNALARLDRSDIVAKLSVPTLFVCAGADEVVSTPAAERLAWRMRTGASLTLPGARHEILQEADKHREPFLAALETFLSEALPDHEEAVGSVHEAAE